MLAHCYSQTDTELPNIPNTVKRFPNPPERCEFRVFDVSGLESRVLRDRPNTTFKLLLSQAIA
jgi:hypothetical protein